MTNNIKCPLTTCRDNFELLYFWHSYEVMTKLLLDYNNKKLLQNIE